MTDVLSTTLWGAALTAPLLLASAIFLLGASRADRSARARSRVVRAAPLALLPFGALALAGPAAGPLDVPWLLLGTHLEVDPVGRALLLLTVLLYAAALIATASSQTVRAAVLTVFLLLSFVGNAVVFVAADAVTFYLGFAAMSLSAYGLVVHERTATAARAARVYLVLTLIGEMTVLAALMMVVGAGGRMLADAPGAVADSEQTGLIVALLLVGFGVKAGTIPLHVWLPLAHPAAPPPASAVLSGAMIKAGLIGWIRFLPLGEAELVGFGTILTVVALLGAFGALIPGLAQNDAKVALAYSSISQMGFLAVLIGTALAVPDLAEACVLAAVVYAVHHGLAKGGLFLGVTVWRTHGEGWVRWWVIGGLGILALAVAGAPFGSGGVAKYAAKQPLEAVDLGGLALTSLLPLVGTVSTLLLIRAGWILLTGDRDRAWGVDGAVLSWSVLIVGGTPVTWYLAESWSPVVSLPGFEVVTIWEAAWPVLLGVALAGTGWWLLQRDLPPRLRRLVELRIPRGDILVPEIASLRRAERWWGRSATAIGEGRRLVRERSGAAARRLPSFVGTVVSAERRLVGWVVSGVVTLLVAGAILWAGVSR